MFGLTFLALVASAAALAVDKRCPEIQPAANFQYDEFRQGKWYGYSRATKLMEIGECGQTEYKPEGDIFKITACHVLKGKQQCINGTGRQAPDADNHGKLIFTYPYHYGSKGITKGNMTEITLNVLASDNKNYAVLYFCKYNEQTNMRSEMSWIFTRSKDISDKTAASLNKSLDESTVIDKTEYKRYNLSEEACRVE